MSFVRSSVLVISCLVFSLPARTQDTTEAVTNGDVTPITVRVRAKGSGAVIKRAEVRVGRDTVLTDPRGEAQIGIPDSGSGKIMVSRFRFESKMIEFDELRGKESIDVFLFPASPSDNEVFIRGENRPETSKKTVSASESARIAPGGDPVQVTQLLPGVQTQAFGGDIAVRGSGPRDSVYWIDNFQVYEIFHNIGGISVLPEQLLSDVEFYAGGFGPRFGDATGGVVRLLTKNDSPEEANTELRINLPIYSAAYHERPLTDDSWTAASARYSYLQYILPYFLQGSDAVVVPYFGDVHSLYVQKDETGGHHKVFVMGSQDGLELIVPYEGSDREDGRAKIDLYRGFATVGYERLKPMGSGWTAVAAPQIIYDRTDNHFFAEDKLIWDYYSGKAFFELTKRISKDESFYVGFEPRYGHMDIEVYAPVPSDDPLFDFEEAPRRRVKKGLDFWNAGAWISVDKKFGDLIVTPGMRFDYDGQINRGQIDPRLRWRYKASEGQTIKGAYGLYSKAPDGGQSSAEFGNPDLDYIKSVHYVLGLESRWNDRWETDLQLYYKKIFNRITPDNETRYSNNGSARSKGAEIFIRRNLTARAFGWLSYTYSVTEQRDSDQDAWHAADFDQTHVATFAGSYRLTATWDLGLRYTYRTGDTYTPISDAVYNANLDKYQPRERAEDRNSKRLPFYSQVDTWVTKDFLLNTWQMALRVGVQYLSFSDQVYARSYNYDYTKEEDFKSLPFIPYIEVRGKF